MRPYLTESKHFWEKPGWGSVPPPYGLFAPSLENERNYIDFPRRLGETFDDDYFNNSYFLEVAEQHQIPFILFLSSYNVVHRVPFIWDIWQATCSKRWSISSADYRKLYENLGRHEKDLLNNENHRPFNFDELKAFASHPLVHLAPHGHTHQPMVGRYRQKMEDELEENLSFLRPFQGTLLEDFSIPCGFYTSHLKRRLLQRFQRIYTIDGGVLRIIGLFIAYP